MNNKEINAFLQELSLLITDLEIQQTMAKQKRLMHKVLLRFEDKLPKKDKKIHGKYIKKLKQRVLSIETIENKLLMKINQMSNQMSEDWEMFETVIKVLKDELNDGN